MPSPTAGVARHLRAFLADERVRYLMVGGVTSGLYYGLFAGAWLLSIGALPYLVVTALAHITTAVLVYPLYRNVVFRSDTRWLSGFVRFYTVFAGGLLASLVGLPVLVELAGAPVLLAQAVIILLVPVASYLAHRFWTFGPSREQRRVPPPVP